MGAMLAQQLVAAGERVVDVPPKLSSRIRLLDRGRIDKTDPNDARSAAIVAWRTPGLNVVNGEDEQRVAARLLADRYHQLTAQRTRSICRLHAVLCLLIEGGTSRALSAERAEKLLASVAASDPITRERVATARQFLTEIRTHDTARAETRKRSAEVIESSATTLTDIHGIGPVIAAIILGHTGDVRRFSSSGHFARHNGTAPIEASSGPKARHRLNPRGNRQLNHALHMAAVTQVGPVPIGRITYLDVRTWVAELTARELAPATVQKAYQTLSKVLRAAVDANLISHSPLPERPPAQGRASGDAVPQAS